MIAPSGDSTMQTPWYIHTLNMQGEFKGFDQALSPAARNVPLEEKQIRSGKYQVYELGVEHTTFISL